MVKIGITVHETQHLFGGDPASLPRVAQLAEEAGIDHVVVGDHLILTKKGAQTYPNGIPVPVDYEQYEPLITLAAMASATRRIRLSTGVVISPLRSAILLAKQVATLDRLSGGRVDLGVGAGWQADEFEASGLPFEGRFARLEEQIRACKALWTSAPASYRGETVSFVDAYSVPLPVQRGGVPIWFGFAPTPKNIERIADLGNGWIATNSRDHRDDLADNIRRLRAAFQARGRDPRSLEVCFTCRPVPGADGRPDLKSTLESARRFAAMGVTLLIFQPHSFCRAPEDLEPFFREIRRIA